MAKYIGSPMGFFRGKIGDMVGGAWKGIDWVRIRVLPTQRGTLTNYRLLKEGLIPPERFSYPQMNIRRAILAPMGHIARMNLDWIYLVWEPLCKKRGWAMTGVNAFVKRSANILLNSMNKDEEYVQYPDAPTNQPDLSEMIVSDGDLEPTPGMAVCNYNPATGLLTVRWDTSHYTNGLDNDLVSVVVAKYPILESAGISGTWYPALYLYKAFNILGGTRLLGSIDLPTTVPPGLSVNEKLYCYAFFKDVAGEIGYSRSKGKEVQFI